MRKLFTVIAVFSLLMFSNVSLTWAQEAPPSVEVTEGQLPIGEEQDPNPPAEETEAAPSEDQNQTFITGVVAGAAIGLVIGAVIAWLLKDKFYKK